MHYLSGDEWGRKPWVADPMPGPIADVFVHHTGSRPRASLTTDLQELQASALGEGYSAIEYHWLVRQDGEIGEGRGWDVEGGATLGHNDDEAPGADPSYAMCAIGYFHPPVSSTVTDALLDAIATTIAEGVELGHIARDYTLRGHRDVRATACPGDLLYPHLPRSARASNGSSHQPRRSRI